MRSGQDKHVPFSHWLPVRSIFSDSKAMELVTTGRQTHEITLRTFYPH